MARQPEVRYINAYVSGTAAYQPEKKPQKKQTVRLPKAKKPQKLLVHVDLAAVGGIVVAAVLAVMLLVGLVQFNNARKEAQMLSEYVVSLNAENKQLRSTYESGYDLEEIRAIAMTMGMVPAEEVPHLQMSVVIPQAEQTPTAWESFWTFMVGLFA